VDVFGFLRDEGHALGGVDVDVGDGEVLALAGPDGGVGAVVAAEEHDIADLADAVAGGDLEGVGAGLLDGFPAEAVVVVAAKDEGHGGGIELGGGGGLLGPAIDGEDELAGLDGEVLAGEHLDGDGVLVVGDDATEEEVLVGVVDGKIFQREAGGGDDGDGHHDAVEDEAGALAVEGEVVEAFEGHGDGALVDVVVVGDVVVLAGRLVGKEVVGAFGEDQPGGVGLLCGGEGLVDAFGGVVAGVGLHTVVGDFDGLGEAGGGRE
jgi:hypothetical protein